MKIAFLFFYTCIILSSSAQKKNYIKQVLFRYTSDNGYVDYLNLYSNKNPLHCSYIGVEINRNNIPIYYKADLVDLMLTDESISFTLKKYKFSYKPFDLEETNKDSVVSKIDIPLILDVKLYFTGRIQEDSIQMSRTSDFYDSKSDKMLFVKESISH